MKVRTYRPDSVQSAFDDHQTPLVSHAQRHRFYTGLTVFLALMLGSFFVVALATFNSKTDDRQRAAGTTGVTIKFAPLSTSLAVNQAMRIPIQLDTAGKAIAVAEILPSFDTTFFEAVSLESEFDVLKVTQQQKTAADGRKKTRWVTALSQPDATLTGTTPIGYMYKTPGTGRKAIHECYINIWDDYMLWGTDTTAQPATFCRNTGSETYKGIIGYAAATQSVTNNMSIADCFDEANLNHAYSNENSCDYYNNTVKPIPPAKLSYVHGWMFHGDTSSMLLNTLVPAKINTNGTFTSLVVAKPITIPPTGDTGSGNIAILTLKPKKAGTTTVSFNQSRTRAPEFKGAPSNIITTYQPITFTISGGAPPPPPPPTAAQTACTQSGGTWKNLPNACVDTCASQTAGTTCAAVITPGCDCGTAKCTNTSGACVANPTAPPAPPATASANLKLQFKLQGLRKAGVTIPATVTVSYTATGSAAVIKQYSKSYTSTTSGVLASSTALPLEGITLTGPIPNAQVFVKTATSLNKKIGTVTLNRGTTQLLTTTELMVGDFNQTGAQRNLFNILDISTMLTQYRALDNPLTDANRAFDVNFDTTFNILDTSLVLSNFEALEKEGESP